MVDIDSDIVNKFRNDLLLLYNEAVRYILEWMLELFLAE